MATTLETYQLLGRSGLRVSPLALGTMTFGTDWGWGAAPEEARRIFDIYVDRGGNFIDTADVYTNGTAERLVGEFAARDRDRLVIATKYTVARRPGDPNSAGNHRKNMVRSVEGSLERLRTDYIDLLYLHAWDDTTPVDEVLRAMDDLVRAGKVLHVGISNTQAWRIARMQAIGELRGWASPVAIQVPYNLLERTVERELIPMAGELGVAVTTYSPLANGVLAGKYGEADLHQGNGSAPGRAALALANGELSERGLAIGDVVREVAAEIGRSPSEVALAWILRNPAITAPVIGARSPAQLEANLGALDLELAGGQQARLDEASAVDLGYPHDFLARPHTRHVMLGGVTLAIDRSGARAAASVAPIGGGHHGS